MLLACIIKVVSSSVGFCANWFNIRRLWNAGQRLIYRNFVHVRVNDNHPFYFQTLR